MALSTGQITDSFMKALGRSPTGDELRQYSNRGDLEGTAGQQVLISELGGGGGYTDPVSALLQSITDDYTKKLENYSKKTSEFDAKNPFVFDEVLGKERAAVKQRLDPYYEQTLSDFLKGTEIKRSRSLEDERTLLSEVQQDTDRVVGEQKQNLTDAIERSREGFADAGLYDSGARLRDQGREEVKTGKNLTDTLTSSDREKQRVTTATNRTGEDLALEEKLKRRELSTDQSYQTESTALSETQRLQRQREFEKGQYTGAYPGVDPTTYQGSLYNILTG